MPAVSVLRPIRGLAAALLLLLLAAAPARSYTSDLFVSNTSSGEVFVLRAAAPGAPELIVNGLSAPTALAFDAGGALYVADAAGLGGGSGHIYRFTSGGTLGSVYASGFGNVTDLAFASDGTLWVSDTERGGDGGIFTVAAGGGATTQFNTPSNSLQGPLSITLDAGNVYTGDTVLDQVRAFDRDAGHIASSTLIFEDLPELEAPEGLAFDGLGNLAIAAGVSEPTVSGRIYLLPVIDGDGAGPGAPVPGAAVEFDFAGAFDIPLDLAIDPGNGNYLVTTLNGELLEHSGATEVSRFAHVLLGDPNSLAFRNGFAPGVQTVPEPSSAALLGLGLAALARRRTKRSLR